MAQTLGYLDASVRKVTLQFSMSHGNQVPRWVTWVKPETTGERSIRKAASVPGEQFLFPEKEKDGSGRDVNDASLVYLVDDLIAAGFTLVEAIAQERLPIKAGAPAYAMVRYSFYREELADCSSDFLRNMGKIMDDLKRFLELATWRVRGFRNPSFSKDGVIVSDAYSISVTMEARNPLFVGNDKTKPQVRWQKDANGDRVGDAPLAVVPGSYVSIIDNEVSLCVEQSAEVSEAEIHVKVESAGVSPVITSKSMLSVPSSFREKHRAVVGLAMQNAIRGATVDGPLDSHHGRTLSEVLQDEDLEFEELFPHP